MAGGNYSVTAGSTINVYQGAQSFVSTVKNTGTGIVYMSAGTPSEANGFPLPPGSSAQWSPNVALNMFSVAGSTISVLDYAASLFDANAVAQQLNASGLAEAIAQEIQLAGVPAIDNPTQIYSATLGDGAGSPLIDVKRYLSVVLQLVQDMSGDATPRVINISFDNGYSYMVSTGGTAAPVYVTLPANGASMTVQVTPATGGAAIGVGVTVIGSYRASAGLSYQFIGATGSQENGVPWKGGTLIATVDFTSWRANTPGNFTTIWNGGNGKNGRARLTVRHFGTAGTLTLEFLDRKTSVGLHPVVAAVAGYNSSQDFPVGNRPWDLYISASGIVGYAEFSLVLS